MGYTINGAPPSSGSSLPAASGANEIPVSSGAGTTYAATSAPGVRTALGAYTTLPDSGWTQTRTGTATATRTGGVTTLTADSAERVLHSCVADVDPAAPNIDITARFDYTSGAPTGSYFALCLFESTSEQYGYLVQVDDAGVVRLYHVNGGSATQIAFVGTVSLTSGTVWLRLVVTAGAIVRAFHGSGSGPTPPTSWTYVGGSHSTSGMTAAVLSLLGVRLVRNAGTGTYTVDVSDLQTRTPGLAA